MLNNYNCIAPFKCVAIDYDGNVKPDAIYKVPLGNLNNHYLVDIWNDNPWTQLRKDHSQFQQNKGCEKCYKKEELSGHSRRLFFETLFVDRATCYNNKPIVTDINTTSFLMLDVIPSNKCNLKCIHCSGAVSTAWVADEKKLLKNMTGYWRNSDYGHFVLDDSVIDNIFADTSVFEDLCYVAIRGGEPMYEPKNRAILQKLIDLGLNKQVTIDISTNATVDDEQLFDHLRQFKSLIFYISIEGTGELYNYTRGGNNYDISVVENMIEKLKTFDNLEEVCITFTTMAANVFAIRDAWNFVQKYKDFCSFSFSNTVVNPAYLSLDVLSAEMKEQAASMIEDIDDKIKWPGQDNYYSVGITKLAQQLKKPEHAEQQKLWKYFKEYIIDLDKIRNTDFISAAPQFKEYWNE